MKKAVISIIALGSIVVGSSVSGAGICGNFITNLPDINKTAFEKMEGKPFREQGLIAGCEIAKIKSIPRTKVGKYDIEVVSFNPIDGGVEAFIKAWKEDGTQIGFGTDGSVEIERVQSFNPPILVGDQNGSIAVTHSFGSTTILRYREDPKQALLNDLAHTLSVKKEIFPPDNIIVGKIGRTTTTVRSSSGATDPTDGNVNRTGVDESFATIRAAAGTGFQVNDSTGGDLGINIKGSVTSNQYQQIYREVMIFDTSAIPSGDTVSAATFSWKAYGAVGTAMGNPEFHLFWGTSAANNTLAASDYQTNAASASIGNSTYAQWSPNANTAPASATFNDITLSSLTNINKGTGARTKLGAGTQWDVNNTTTGLTWSSGGNSGIYIYTADTTGTADDPKLVIEHAAAAASTFKPGATSPRPIID